MQVINLTKKDIENILKLEGESAPEKPHYSGYSIKELQDFFDNPEKCQVFGIWSDNKLIGWSSYKCEKDNSYEIGSLVIDKNYRGKGLGKALMQHTIKEILKKDSTAEIYLTVYPQNLNALKLYLTNNFVVYDFKKDYYGPGSDRLFLKYSKQ